MNLLVRRRTLPPQQEFWIVREDIRAGSSDTYFDKLGAVLDAAGFGDSVPAPFYREDDPGRPPLDPEVYFRMLYASSFEGTCSERGIASRCEDSIMLRRFLGYDLTERTPDHSTLSQPRAAARGSLRRGLRPCPAHRARRWTAPGPEARPRRLDDGGQREHRGPGQPDESPL